MGPATLAYVGLGANLGDTRLTLAQALQDLDDGKAIRLLRTSAHYRTAPVDAGGPDYRNAVAEIRTTLPALDLLHRLQAIEQAHGRERPYRNAPRTLDLDLLYYGGLKIDTPVLQVPHPRMHERAFVLFPLAELAPDLTLPQGRLSSLRDACGDQRIDRLPDQG